MIFRLDFFFNICIMFFIKTVIFKTLCKEVITMNRITATDGLLCHKRTIKLYDSLLKRACDQYSLSPVEITIISFLHNNPSQDTAGEIAELRSLPKGNVSQGV